MPSIRICERAGTAPPGGCRRPSLITHLRMKLREAGLPEAAPALTLRALAKLILGEPGLKPLTAGHPGVGALHPPDTPPCSAAGNTPAGRPAPGSLRFQPDSRKLLEIPVEGGNPIPSGYGPAGQIGVVEVHTLGCHKLKGRPDVFLVPDLKDPKTQNGPEPLPDLGAGPAVITGQHKARLGHLQRVDRKQKLAGFRPLDKPQGPLKKLRRLPGGQPQQEVGVDPKKSGHRS